MKKYAAYNRKKSVARRSALAVLFTCFLFLVLFFVFDAGDKAKPASLGTTTLAETVAASRSVTEIKTVLEKRGNSVNLPVLMYHHLAASTTQDTTISTEVFRNQMATLKENGYHPITIRQLLDYVYRAVDLPDKPVLITFDDGYTSNLTLAGPILKEYGFHAAIFLIGHHAVVGPFASSGEKLTFFSLEEAKPLVDEGIFEIQCHSYDFHGSFADEPNRRRGMLPFDGETEEDYEKAIRKDLWLFSFREVRSGLDEADALSYPYGFYSKQLDDIVKDFGIKVTFTIEPKRNCIVIGDPNSLRMLGRYNCTDRVDAEKLLSMMNGTYKGR